MANRRMISSETFRDEFAGALDLFGFKLWIGLITASADDQGRLLNNPRLIRSDIFPFDDRPIHVIEEFILGFADAQKVTIYEADGKSLIQINNWWEYQTPAWASPSKFPAPPNWTDREKYHAIGNKIVVNNWDKKGGFSDQHSPLHSNLSRPLNDVNGEGESEGEGYVPPASFSGSPEVDLYHEVTGLYPSVTEEPKVIADIASLRKKLNYPPVEKVKSVMLEKYSLWKSSRTADGRPYNPSNPAWLEWCITGFTPLPYAPKLDPESQRLEAARQSAWG